MPAFEMSGCDNFNPRSREGSDQISLALPTEPNNFNPRSREGSDKKGRNWMVDSEISTHAPVKGATRTARTYSHMSPFQPTLP